MIELSRSCDLPVLFNHQFIQNGIHTDNWNEFGYSGK